VILQNVSEDVHVGRSDDHSCSHSASGIKSLERLLDRVVSNKVPGEEQMLPFAVGTQTQGGHKHSFVVGELVELHREVSRQDFQLLEGPVVDLQGAVRVLGEKVVLHFAPDVDRGVDLEAEPVGDEIIVANLESKIRKNSKYKSKTVLVGSLEAAKNFRVYSQQFGDPTSEISDQNFQNCGSIRDILKKTFS